MTKIYALYSKEYDYAIENKIVYGHYEIQHTYIIGHYNPSVRIIAPVSHATYFVCVNFIHKWRDLQYKVDSERQIF